VTPTGLLVLTDRTQCEGPLLTCLSAAVDAGARTVVVREKDLPTRERERLAREVRALLAPVDGTVIVAGTEGDRVHLTAADAFPEPRPELVGRSCHSADELENARREGCDYATISSLHPTDSKPGYGPALGLEALATLTPVGPPTYALGGGRVVRPDACLAAGAAGVAVMGAVMREPRLVAAYLERLAQVAR
jgi:thiamine monophosphate synthase